MTKEEVRKKTIEKIHERLTQVDPGFKYFKSRGGFEKKLNGFLFGIGFGSSRVNILDDTNLMIITASVDCEEFGVWKKKNFDVYPSGQIGCGKIKNIFTPGPPYYDFDLMENEYTRLKVMEEVSSILTTSILDFFEICTDTDKILENIHLPCFSVEQLILYYEFRNLGELIPKLVARAAEVLPDIYDHIGHYLNHLKINGDGQFPETYKDDSKREALRIARSLSKINYTSEFKPA